MTFASTFAGIGGFDLGLERAGMTPLWHCEIDPAASAVLAAHWPEVPNLGDISTIDGTRLRLQADRRPGDVDAVVHRAHADGDEQPRAGRPDLLCGGFPCQDLSVAGRRKGLDGARSGLFFEFARLADELRPRWVVLENVAGLLSSAAGRDFAVLLHTLAGIGYEDLSWRVVDSLNFGVPQRRRRVLIVGHLGAGTATRQVLLEPEGRPWSAPPGGQAGPGVAATLTAGSRSGRGVNPPGRRQEDDVNLVAAEYATTLQGGGERGYRVDAEGAAVGHLIASAITAREGKGPDSGVTSGNIVASTLTASAGHHGHSSPRGDGTDNLAPTFATTLQSAHRGVPSAEEASTRAGAEEWGGQVVPATGLNTRQDPIHGEGFVGPLDTDAGTQAVAFHENQRGELTETGHTQAIAGQGGKPGQGYAAVRIGARVRRLTPTECERLQGFPDGWTVPAGSDSARYRCLGNAVSVPVIEWLGRRIVDYEAGTLGALSPDPRKHEGAAA